MKILTSVSLVLLLVLLASCSKKDEGTEESAEETLSSGPATKTAQADLKETTPEQSDSNQGVSYSYVGKKGYKLSLIGRILYPADDNHSAKFIYNHVNLKAKEDGGITIVTDKNGQRLKNADYTVITENYFHYLIDPKNCLDANDIKIIMALTKKEPDLTPEERTELNSVWAKSRTCEDILVDSTGGSNLSAKIDNGHLMLSGEMKIITFDPKFQRKGGTRVLEDSRFVIFEISEVTHKLNGLSLGRMIQRNK